MQRTFIHLLLLGLSTLCAGTPADTDVDPLFPGPSSTHQTRASAGVDDWYSLLRRNVGQMVKRSEGIRTEADVQNLDLESWSKETVNLCAKKLNSTTIPSNPAGLAGCWNIPVLVASSGVFAADLRIFKVADPTGDWVNADVSSYNISLQYDGTAALQARNMTEKEIVASAEGMPSNVNITKLVDSQFIGNLDSSATTSSLSDAELKVMVTPQISIKAVTSSGKMISTTVNTTDSQYLNGVFADTPSLTQEETAEATTTHFVLPGTKISIVPAGLYFISAYTAVAAAIFGWGTLERAKFRDQYRKRIATQGSR